tara:strand:+ start:2059 stop:4353 length:2295 start_codon:yes stop_codon:yes gene_type:complete
MSSWSGSDLIGKTQNGVQPIYQDGFPPMGYLSHPTDPRPTFAWVVEEITEGSQGVYAYFPTEELAKAFERTLKQPRSGTYRFTDMVNEEKEYPYKTKITKKVIDDGKFWVKISKKPTKKGRKWVSDYRVDVIKDFDELKKTVESENKNGGDLDKIVYGELTDENWSSNPFYKGEFKKIREDSKKVINEEGQKRLLYPVRASEKYISNPIHFDSIDGSHKLIPRPKYNGFKEEGGPFIHYNVGFGNEEVKVFTAFDYDEEDIDSFEESLAEGNISAGELFENGYSEIYDELGQKTGQRLVFTIPQLFTGKWSKMADNLDRRGNGEQVLDFINLSKAITRRVDTLANTGTTASPNKRYGDYIEDLVGSGWYIERTPEFAFENGLTYKYNEKSPPEPYLIQRLGGVGGRSYPRPRIASIENPPDNFVDLGNGRFRIPDVGELTDIAFSQRANPEFFDWFRDVDSKYISIPRRYGSENYLRINKDAIGVDPDISDWSYSKTNRAWLNKDGRYFADVFPESNHKLSFSNFVRVNISRGNREPYIERHNHYVRKIGDDYFSNTNATFIWEDQNSARKAANWNRRNGIKTRTIKVKNGYANLAQIPKSVIDEINNNRKAVEYVIRNGKNKGKIGNSITDYLKGTKRSQIAEEADMGIYPRRDYTERYIENINKIKKNTRRYFKEKYPSCVVNASESSGISKDKLLASFKRGVGAAKTNPESIRNKFTGKKRPGGWPKSQRYSPKAWGCARAKKLARLGNKAGYDQDILRGD